MNKSLAVTYKLAIITKKNLTAFVNKLIKTSKKRVVGVTRKDNKFAFNDLNDAAELCLDYDVTLQSPKKYFQIPYETIAKYDLDKFGVEEVNQSSPIVVIGVHPYDIVALRQMETVFRDGIEDPNYLDKWNEAILIGVNIKNVSPFAFAGSMNSAVIDSGFDLMLTDIGNDYTIEVGSDKGRELLKKYAKVTKADDKTARKVADIKSKIPGKFKKQVTAPLGDIPKLIADNPDHPVWEKKAATCFSCGTCNMVCPTCYCFDIIDLPALNLKGGIRIRTPDGCLLEDFAKVATGENFRGNRTERYHHRFRKKGKYLYDKYGFIACVGCGRSSRPVCLILPTHAMCSIR